MLMGHRRTLKVALPKTAIACFLSGILVSTFATVSAKQHLSFVNTNSRVFAKKTSPFSFSLQQPPPRNLAAFSTSSDWKARSMSAMKRDSPSAQRNKQVIWEVLKEKVLSNTYSSSSPYRVLEIAAGSGVHTSHFASQLLKETQTEKSFLWYPTDADASVLSSIEAYRNEIDSTPSNVVQPPLWLTLNADGIEQEETISEIFGPEGAATIDLIVCINMIHISPWEATKGLMKLASDRLSPDGHLYCYGPYKVGGTAVESNLSFDQNLKSRDASWGVRDLEEVKATAEANGLQLSEKIEMPANNLSLIYTKKKH